MSTTLARAEERARRLLVRHVADRLLSAKPDGHDVAMITLHGDPVRVTMAIATRYSQPPALHRLMGAAHAVIHAPETPEPPFPVSFLTLSLLMYLECKAVAIVGIPADTPDEIDSVTLLIDPDSQLTGERVRMAAAHALLSPPETLP